MMQKPHWGRGFLHQEQMPSGKVCPKKLPARPKHWN